MSEPFVKIWLPGEPRGKGRPRARIARSAKGPFISFYPDPETAKYERALAYTASVIMAGRTALDEPLSVAVDAFLSVPASWTNRERDKALTGQRCPTGKPDSDNFLKIVDALNGIVWRDDSLIVRAIVGKFYSENPGLLVSVWKWLD